MLLLYPNNCFLTSSPTDQTKGQMLSKTLLLRGFMVAHGVFSPLMQVINPRCIPWRFWPEGIGEQKNEI